MKKRNLTVMIVLTLLALATMAFFIVKSIRPSQSQIMAAESGIKPVPEVVKSGSFDAVTKDLEKHGNVPVKVDASELGKEDPFAG